MNKDLLTHIVVFWLKPDCKYKLDEILNAALSLNEIPGLISFDLGKMISSERDVVDKTYDFAFNMTFSSKQDLDSYICHEIHEDFVNKHVKPNIEKIKVFDFSL